MDLREEVHELLGSIERYNPNNLDIFIEYAKATVREQKRRERERETLFASDGFVCDTTNCYSGQRVLWMALKSGGERKREKGER